MRSDDEIKILAYLSPGAIDCARCGAVMLERPQEVGFGPRDSSIMLSRSSKFETTYIMSG
eukprot:1385475-Amorphochlora_amoeboformis.AAC.1